MSEWQSAGQRYAAHTVILTRDTSNGQERLIGTQYVEYPVDVPAVVEVPSLGVRLLRSVWLERGWQIEEAS